VKSRLRDLLKKCCPNLGKGKKDTEAAYLA
jgi:hypothetical protein